jgi:hypothetical protein
LIRGGEESLPKSIKKINESEKEYVMKKMFLCLCLMSLLGVAPIEAMPPEGGQQKNPIEAFLKTPMRVLFGELGELGEWGVSLLLHLCGNTPSTTDGETSIEEVLINLSVATPKQLQNIIEMGNSLNNSNSNIHTQQGIFNDVSAVLGNISRIPPLFGNYIKQVLEVVVNDGRTIVFFWREKDRNAGVVQIESNNSFKISLI